MPILGKMKNPIKRAPFRCQTHWAVSEGKIKRLTFRLAVSSIFGLLEARFKGGLFMSSFVWVPFRNSCGFLNVLGDRLEAYPLSMGNFHLWTFLYVFVLAALILLSLFYCNLFFFFEPIAGSSRGKKRDAENVPPPSPNDEILKIILVHVSI